MRFECCCWFGSCSILAKYSLAENWDLTYNPWRSTPSPTSSPKKHKTTTTNRYTHPTANSTSQAFPFAIRWWATRAWWSSTTRWTVMASSDGENPVAATSTCIAPPLRMVRCCCEGTRSASTCLGNSLSCGKTHEKPINHLQSCVKWCHKASIWEWFIESIYKVIWGMVYGIVFPTLQSWLSHVLNHPQIWRSYGIECATLREQKLSGIKSSKNGTKPGLWVRTFESFWNSHHVHLIFFGVSITESEWRIKYIYIYICMYIYIYIYIHIQTHTHVFLALSHIYIYTL